MKTLFSVAILGGLCLVLAACDTTAATTPDDAAMPVDMAAPAPDLITYPACQGPTPMGAAFNTAPGGIDSRTLAGDFTLPTLDGDWSFKSNWTGCDSYVFVIYSSSIQQSVQVWNSDVSSLIANSPTNVHYFFLSNAQDSMTVTNDIMSMKTQVDAAVADLSADDQASWAGRFHYVTTGARGLNNWISQMIAKRTAAMVATLAFGIDRQQYIREVGLLEPVTGQAEPWEIDFLAYEVRYYNFEWTREQALEAEKAPTILHVFDGTQTSETVDVAFPAANVMQGFDTMELDMGMWCTDHLENNCAQWDYIQDLQLCDADSGPAPDGGSLPCNNPVIIGRFITTYHREGRWVVDVSPLLAYLKDGGTRRLAYGSQYLNQLDIRLSNSGKGGGHPDSATPLWNGDFGFNATYNMNFMPQMIAIPANATRVQLFAFISGHGFGEDLANCAEFCDHEHHFTINGTEYLKDFPEAGTDDGCIDHIEDGTIPNQYGTWPIGRGGWCPGLEVKPFVADVTANVTPGQMATISYRGTYDGKTYVPVPHDYMDGGFGAVIRLQSWLVVWTN